jgi:nucleotide-binding universal stress UspA family protein
MTAHILTGIDFSEGALAALWEARELARLMRLELRLMHVEERGSDSNDREAMSGWLEAAEVDPASVGLRVGQPWIELAREAADTGAGMLVVGSHGHRGRQPIGLGSTAACLGLIAPCPLVVVGPRAAGPAESRTRKPRADACRPILNGE